jgi:hypothetical protein
VRAPVSDASLTASAAGERALRLFATDRLEEIVASLEHAGRAVERYDSIVDRRQAFVQDPFGNLLELTELPGPYA